MDHHLPPDPAEERPKENLEETRGLDARRLIEGSAGAPADPPIDRLGAADDITTSSLTRGLLCYKKWWYLRKVGVSVNGTLLTGIPAFIRGDTMRIFDKKYSYIIPMRNVDYIRTPDGLEGSELEFDEPQCWDESP